MTARSTIRNRPVYYDGEFWRYVDTDSIAHKYYKKK